MAISSMLASMADWSTPTVLFCLLNLMIATIFIASNFKSPNNHHHDTPSQLTGSSSPWLLERVKSVNLSSFYTSSIPESTEYNSASQLSRPPSLLQRVKSIDFSFSSFHNSFPTESEQLSNSPTERTRTLSLIDRVKSFKLTSHFNSDQHSGHTSSSKDEDSDIDPHHDSVSETSGVTPANRPPGKKVAESEGGEEDDDDDRKPPARKKAAVPVNDESVDAKADDFIKRFKHQLKLQRLDSLQRLREMLNRGTSSG